MLFDSLTFGAEYTNGSSRFSIIKWNMQTYLQPFQEQLPKMLVTGSILQSFTVYLNFFLTLLLCIYNLI